MDLSVNEFGDIPEPYVDEAVTITPIPLSLSSPKPAAPTSSAFVQAFSYPPPTFEGTEDEVLEYKKNIVHEMFKSGIAEEDIADETTTTTPSDAKRDRRTRRLAVAGISLPPTEPADITMAYLLKNNDLRGKLNMQKVIEAKVPVGPLLARLKAGEDIEFPVEVEGGGTTMRVLKSADVLGKPIHGPVVLILDVPKVEYVELILRNERLNSEAVKAADVVVHMLADEVADNQEYIKWMESFAQSTKVISIQSLD
jgi:hypothetical protein